MIINWTPAECKVDLAELTWLSFRTPALPPPPLHRLVFSMPSNISLTLEYRLCFLKVAGSRSQQQVLQ